jgi:predicted nucleic acid-binding protein
VIVCDTGPLVEAADRGDADNRACTDLFTGLHLARRPILVPAPVVAEVGYLLGRTGGARIESTFLRSIAQQTIIIVDLELADYERMAQLVDLRRLPARHYRRSRRRGSREAADHRRRDPRPPPLQRRPPPTRRGVHASPVIHSMHGTRASVIPRSRLARRPWCSLSIVFTMSNAHNGSTPPPLSITSRDRNKRRNGQMRSRLGESNPRPTHYEYAEPRVRGAPPVHLCTSDCSPCSESDADELHWRQRRRPRRRSKGSWARSPLVPASTGNHDDDLHTGNQSDRRHRTPARPRSPERSPVRLDRRLEGFCA